MAICLVIALSACGGGTSASATTSSSSEVDQRNKSTGLTVYYAGYDSRDGWAFGLADGYLQ